MQKWSSEHYKLGLILMNSVSTKACTVPVCFE